MCNVLKAFNDVKSEKIPPADKLLQTLKSLGITSVNTATTAFSLITQKPAAVDPVKPLHNYR